MQFEVLVFGRAAQVAGSDRVTVRVGDAEAVRATADATLAATAGAPFTARDVLEAIAAQHPALAAAATAGRLAVNQEFAQPGSPVRAGDELALIALVGGG